MEQSGGHHYFSKRTFAFLTGLAGSNTREWFAAHQQDYEEFVRTPALELIGDMADQLPAISRHFTAQPRKVGGSLMRIQRDTRFGRDKTPYKTNIGIQFRHELGKDIHAPGYYLHIEPDDCFLGIGLWHPDAQALGKIREALVEHGKAWVAARDDTKFRRHFTLVGDALVNPPHGFAKEHSLLEDLKRKDFIGLAPLTLAEVTSAKLRSQMVEYFRHAAPFMRFLCQALSLPF
ncbi:MAG: TIGR02453 family protein [Desulfobulbaceae bacterium A2]|nr:MAG: TIGR02453 family protein [Desulfobulbaceae bacterium A2]